MAIVLRHLDNLIEQKFRNLVKTKYGDHKGNEKKFFSDMVIFFNDKDGQDLYKNWVKELSDPIKKKKMIGI